MTTALKCFSCRAMTHRTTNHPTIEQGTRGKHFMREAPKGQREDTRQSLQMDGDA